MNRENPTVSIIIPSHNRSSSLRRGLEALHSQTYPLELISVIVVADSCIDDTLAMLQDYKAPFKLQVIEVNCRSAAIARNTGAASATGQLLLFLDEDIEALPPWWKATRGFTESVRARRLWAPIRLSCREELDFLTWKCARGGKTSFIR